MEVYVPSRYSPDVTGTEPRHHDRQLTAGLLFALVTNLVWVGQPLYWPLVGSSGPVELLAHRVMWSAVLCSAVVMVGSRQRARFKAVVQRSRRLGLLAVCGVLMTTGWGIYIYAVNSGQVVEASLGLFMIPLVTVLAGVIGFGERLRAAQRVAVLAALAATVVLTVGYGQPPWIALILSALMAGYNVVKKRAAAPALEGFTVECLVVVPAALVYLTFLLASGGDTVISGGPGHFALVAASGLITAVPLVAHAASLIRLPLVTIGVLQYLNPTGQFLLGVLVRNEDMPLSRWIGFALVWTAVAVFAVGSIPRRGQRSSTRSSRWTTSRS